MCVVSKDVAAAAPTSFDWTHIQGRAGLNTPRRCGDRTASSSGGGEAASTPMAIWCRQSARIRSSPGASSNPSRRRRSVPNTTVRLSSAHRPVPSRHSVQILVAGRAARTRIVVIVFGDMVVVGRPRRPATPGVHAIPVPATDRFVQRYFRSVGISAIGRQGERAVSVLGGAGGHDPM